MITVEEVKFAEKEMEELNSKLIKINEKRVVLMQNIEQQIRDIFDKYLIEDATIFNKDINIQMDGNREIEFSLRIGFKDPEREGWSAFGADFNLYVEDNTIKINHGTIGSYSKESEPFQVKRVYAIANIWKNKEALKTELDEIDVEEYREARSMYYDIRNAIQMCKNILNKAADEQLVESIKSKDKYNYSSTCKYDLKNKYMSSYKSNLIIEIVNITTDNIIYSTIDNQSCYSGHKYRVPKSKFISFVKAGKLQKIV